MTGVERLFVVALVFAVAVVLFLSPLGQIKSAVYLYSIFAYCVFIDHRVLGKSRPDAADKRKKKFQEMMRGGGQLSEDFGVLFPLPSLGRLAH